MTCRIRGLSSVLLVFVPIVACEVPPPAAQGCESASPQRVATDRPGFQKVSASWPNAPPGLPLLNDGALAAWSQIGWRCEGAGLSVAFDSTAPASPAEALVFTYGQGAPSGYAPGVVFFDPPKPTPETYFGFWWKPSKPWESHRSGINKIAFLFPVTSGAGSMYIMMFYDGVTYTIQVVTAFASDNRRLEPNVTVPGTSVALGKWHQIEWYVRYSTGATSHDGVVKWWIDGVPQGAYTDLQLPPDVGFTEYTIRPVWGGAVGDIKRETDTYAYGRVHISAR